jgi:hypothetical protein
MFLGIWLDTITIYLTDHPNVTIRNAVTDVAQVQTPINPDISTHW